MAGGVAAGFGAGGLGALIGGAMEVLGAPVKMGYNNELMTTFVGIQTVFRLLEDHIAKRLREESCPEKITPMRRRCRKPTPSSSRSSGLADAAHA